MEPEQVLDLIHTAPDRHDTVRAALRYRGDGRVRGEIRSSIPLSEAGRRAFGVPENEAPGPVRHPGPAGPSGWRCRAWHAGMYAGAWRRGCRAAG